MSAAQPLPTNSSVRIHWRDEARAPCTCARPASDLVEHEHVELSATREQHVLLAVEHERLWRVLQRTDLRVPERLASERVPCFHVLSVADEEHAARRREQPRDASVDLLAPDDLAGLV